MDFITVDFAKAFDFISHNKLLYKLKMYGICGKIHTWIKEFLINRFFNVKIKPTLSKKYPVISSTPQGSKLAPLLYILYANDISKVFKYIKIKMYADDVTIYRQLRIKLSYVLELAKIKIFRDMKKTCFPRYYSQRS